MRKSTAVIAFASLMFSASSFAASGTGGSGSAGAGIDLAGLTVAISSAPYATITGGEGTLGGPFTGLAKWALKRN